MRRALTAPLLVAVVAAGCGDDPAQSPPRAEPRVTLTLGGPADAAVVRGETVELRGTVRPAAARVQVLGREVPVEQGAFRTEVALEPGANLIDVAASARGRRPDFAVRRIVREERVPVPDVVDGDADTAREQLEGLGLGVRIEDAGGFLDPILPGDPKVCATEPAAGEQVLPGSEVTLRVARDC